MMLEEFDEAATTETSFGDNFGDAGGLRGAEESFDGELDSGMVVEHTSSALEQCEFHGAKFGSGSGRFQDAIAKLAREVAPKVGKIKLLIAEFRAG